MNRQLRRQTREDALLDTAFDEHRADECWKCGNSDNNVVATRYGFEVICAHCGATVAEVDLDDVEETIYY